MGRAVPRWILQSAVGIVLALSVNFVLTGATPSADQSTPQTVAATNGTCPEGYTGSSETGCVDVNECSFNNGGCHRLAGCENTPGSRTCGECPEDFAGNGYIGCFDVNECPAGDCSGRMPPGAADAAPPVVTTSGDVTVAATSEAGAEATFTATAKDGVDGTRSVYCLPASGASFPIGKTTVSCWSINRRGKIGRTSLSVTVTRPQF
jgi:hypothetical protein